MNFNWLMRPIKHKNIYSGIMEYTGFIVFALAIFYAPSYLWWWTLVMYLAFSGIGIRAGYHALFAHRSYEAPEWWKLLCLIMGTVTMIGPLIIVTALHRVHHRIPDTKEDPSTCNFFHRVVRIPYPGEKLISREMVSLNKQEMMKLSYNYTMHINIAYAFVMLTVGLLINEPWFIVMSWFLPAWISIWAFTINRITSHNMFPFNYRRFDTPDNSQNNAILALFLCGEGLHNNHHKYPGRYYYAETWWEWLLDWPALLIWMVKKNDTK